LFADPAYHPALDLLTRSMQRGEVSRADARDALALIADHARGEPLRKLYVEVIAQWPIADEAKAEIRTCIAREMGTQLALQRMTHNPFVLRLQEKLARAHHASARTLPAVEHAEQVLTNLHAHVTPERAAAALWAGERLVVDVRRALNSANAALAASRPLLDAAVMPTNRVAHSTLEETHEPVEPMVQTLPTWIERAELIARDVVASIRGVVHDLRSRRDIARDAIALLFEKLDAVRGLLEQSARFAAQLDAEMRA
jgi:hypothetical protein